jgi:hypothetical protein
MTSEEPSPHSDPGRIWSPSGQAQPPIFVAAFSVDSARSRRFRPLPNFGGSELPTYGPVAATAIRKRPAAIGTRDFVVEAAVTPDRLAEYYVDRAATGWDRHDDDRSTA